MVTRNTPIPDNATEFGAGLAVARGLGGLSERIRSLETGSNRGPGSSFEMPFKLVGPTGTWYFDENADGVLVVCNDATLVAFEFRKEIVFSYSGSVDTTDVSGPWASAVDIVIDTIVILAGVAGELLSKWAVAGAAITLPAGATSVTTALSVPIPADTPFTSAFTGYGPGPTEFDEVEDVTVIVRYTERCSAP